MYYFSAQSMSQVCDQIIQQNNQLIGYDKVYIVGVRDASYDLDFDLMLQYYSANKNIKTNYVDQLSDIPVADRTSSKVLLIGYDSQFNVVQIKNSTN